MKPSLRHTLVLGGAGSGKSLHAEQLALQNGARAYYVPTAFMRADDAEMTAKIKAHQDRRVQQGNWKTHSINKNLPKTLKVLSQDGHTILVDCLTLWLSGLLEHEKQPDFEPLCTVLATLDSPVIFVSNELGMGLVPDTSLGRSFRTLHGQMNQAVAACVDTVIFVAAGCPLVLKG